MAGTWAACPYGRHELRYFDGQRWTEHVSDNGQQSTDPIDTVIQGEAVNVTPTSARTNDISSNETIWSGESQSLTTAMTGGRVVQARYRLTRDALHFDVGTLTSHSEMVPLWGVMDVDVLQSITQKPRKVGDVRVHLDPATGARFGQRMVPLKSVQDPQRVRDLVLQQVREIRRYQMDFHHEREIGLRQAGAGNYAVNIGSPLPQSEVPAAEVPALPSASSLVEQLKELASLRDAGILTQAEFERQKDRVLGS